MLEAVILPFCSFFAMLAAGAAGFYVVDLIGKWIDRRAEEAYREDSNDSE